MTGYFDSRCTNDKIDEFLELQQNASKLSNKAGPGMGVINNEKRLGPRVCSEFYPGWTWGCKWQEDEGAITPMPSLFMSSFAHMYQINASFSLYMFYGGTNFGFTNGAYEKNSVYIFVFFGAPF